VGEVAMFFAISDFTAVKRGALCAARVVVGAVVDSSGGGIWGVNDPLCHPLITVPGRVFGGRSRPKCMSLSSGTTRASSVTLRSAPPVSWIMPAVDFIDENTPVRFLPETAFL
jgi:hypothetical protein